MNISHVSTLEDFKTTHESFIAISTLWFKAHKAINSNVILHLPNANKGDGNLASIFAAMSYLLVKSNNLLIILPKRFRSYQGPFFSDIFRVTTSRFLRDEFWEGGTELASFEPNKYFEFGSYLEKRAFNKYPRISSLIVDQLKSFLAQLFVNACYHGASHSNIFICSSYRGNELKFTIVDCGQGFLRRVKQVNNEIVNEEEAIIWSIRGNSVRGANGSGCLRLLAPYCLENNGSLIVISGSTSVTVEKMNEYKVSNLPGPFRGAIISLSINV